MKTFAALAGAILIASFVRGEDVAELVTQLKSKDGDLRRNAAKTLGDMGADAKAAVPALAQALKDDDLFVRRFAAQSLGLVGPDAKAAVPALKAALNDPKKEVASAAAESLAKVGPDGVKVLGDVLKNDKADVEVRRRAVVGLGKAGGDVKPLLPQLAELLQDRDLKMDVVSSVAELGTNAKDDKIIKGLQDMRDDKGVKKDTRQMLQATIRSVQGKKEK